MHLMLFLFWPIFRLKAVVSIGYPKQCIDFMRERYQTVLIMAAVQFIPSRIEGRFLPGF